MLQHPSLFVCVPRAVAEQYWHQPWADIYEAAKRGIDGLAIHDGRPQLWRGPQDGDIGAQQDVCYLSQGQQGWEDRACLYQQNW
jgi:hypothetical protein